MIPGTPARLRVLGLVFTLLAVPLLLAAAEAIGFHVQNRNNGRVVSSGETREYLLYVPKSHDAAKPAPLVISLHGGAGWPALHRDISGWNRLAEQRGFLVAYPAGLDAGGMTGWRVIRPGPDLDRDVGFISDLIDEVGETYRVDPSRIYANGLSNGGSMAFVLSCALSDRIAAVGLVAAANKLPWSWCTDDRPVPMISLHGTGDTAAPYRGGTSWVIPGLLPSVTEWTANWARRNRCGEATAEQTVATGVTRREYTGCADDASVVLFTIEGGGHTWPGGALIPEWFAGPTSQEVDATAEMWSFFQQHSLRPVSGTSSP